MSLGRTTCYSCINCMVGVTVSKPIRFGAHHVTLFLWGLLENRLELELSAQLWARSVLPLETEPNSHEFGQGVERIRHRGEMWQLWRTEHQQTWLCGSGASELPDSHPTGALSCGRADMQQMPLSLGESLSSKKYVQLLLSTMYWKEEIATLLINWFIFLSCFN